MKKVALENYLTRFVRYVIDWRKTRRHEIESLAYTELQRRNYEK